jgi:DNA-binding beta-propeller fold protein YncE
LSTAWNYAEPARERERARIFVAPMRLHLAQRVVALVAALSAGAVADAPAADAAPPTDTRDVLVASNNWDGTADFIDPQSFQRLMRLNIVPDRDQRLAEIAADPVALGYYALVQQEIGEGHDQLVDDAFTSHDGRYLYVSRPSFADVVAFDLTTKQIVWRARVDGYRSDHMAISPDGTRLAVSASTGNVVDVIDTTNGQIVAKVPAGESPHENNFSKDGSLLFQASIGKVYTPTDDPSMDATKGDRYFEVIDTKTWQVIKKVHIAQKLAEAGYPDMSDSIRPMAIAPDERHFYFQLSFLHGFVEYDLAQDKVLRVKELPVSDHDKNMRRDEYVLDSAHHGLTMNPDGTKLCAAGTMDNYIALVHRDDFSYKIIDTGERPYWSTTSTDGRYCFVSIAGEDRIDVIDYASEKRVASIPVGDRVQRSRMGRALTSVVGAAPKQKQTKPREKSRKRRHARRHHRRHTKHHARHHRRHHHHRAHR